MKPIPFSGTNEIKVEEVGGIVPSILPVGPKFKVKLEFSIPMDNQLVENIRSFAAAWMRLLNISNWSMSFVPDGRIH